MSIYMRKLQSKIMRGIYYAYALRLVSLPGVWQGFFMLGVLIALTRFVSLGNVLNNMTNIEMTGMGQFFFNAVRNTEAWTLLLIGVLVFLSLSVRFSLAPKKARYSFARI